MPTYTHICPYCGTQLSINQLSIEKTASHCPLCHGTIILLDYGKALKKPHVYRCLKCNKELIYEGKPSHVHCDSCDSFFSTSRDGDCIISSELLYKGNNGELNYKKKRDRKTELHNSWICMSQKKKLGIIACVFTLIFVSIGAYIWSLPFAIEKSLAYADMENVWTEFREKHPYNFQMEGIKHYDDNSYVVIISEPNENITEKELKNFFKKYNCEFRTNSIKIGYDGWLRDAVISFNNLNEKDIPNFAGQLSKLLYGTDYKASLLDLNTIPEHIPFSSYDLNAQVTEEELRKWFIEDKELLVNYENKNEITTLLDIFHDNHKKTELFYSKECGFIIWVLTKGECDKLDFKITARKFALDSDIILGAIKMGSTIAIIARERCVPIYELPPMRQGTLCLLAGTNEYELAQSYERTSLFAGKQKGGKDYAPIYLSDELWHTEYGNLLNVTDQMLKSWSENGMIDYVDFDYPKPVDWAFECGVRKDLGVSTLTYNWNTEGVGYIVEDEDSIDKYALEIYALNRTGSLPVSYIPGESRRGISEKDKVYLAEQQAYDFFSNLSSPELVKVVQYASMYQIFKNFGITIKQEGNRYNKDVIMIVPDQLKHAANQTIQSLAAHFTQQDKEKIVEHFGVQLVSEDNYQQNDDFIFGIPIGDNLRVVKKNENDEDRFQIIICAELILSLDSIHQALFPLSSDNTLMDCLGAYLIDRQGTLQYSIESENYYNLTHNVRNIFNMNQRLPIQSSAKMDYKDCISNALQMLESHSFDIQEYNFIVGDISVEESKQLYLEVNKDKNLTWMKCPTVVESWQLDDSVHGIGGHNLNSKTTKFKVNRKLKAGETRIGQDGTIEISTQDRLSRVSNQDYLRKAGRLGDYSMAKTIAIRPKYDVVGITTKRTARGFNSTDHLVVNVDYQRGHTMNGKKYTDLTDLLYDLGNNLVEGDAPFKQIEIIGLKNSGIDVDLILDGTRAHMKKGQFANIPLSKYDFSNYVVKYENDRAIVTIPIKAGNIEFASTSFVTEAGLGGFSNIKPHLNIKEGNVTFKVPKHTLPKFLNVLKQYFFQKGVWNEFKLKMRMRINNINPNDCEETTKLKIAKMYNINSSDYVWYIQEKTA